MPQSPQIYQCGFFYDKDEPVKSEFICVNNKDDNDVIVRPMSRMQGAQALDIPDFKKMNRYVDEVKKRLVDAINSVQAEFGDIL